MKVLVLGQTIKRLHIVVSVNEKEFNNRHYFVLMIIFQKSLSPFLKPAPSVF